jgi:hypothetical protein
MAKKDYRSIVPIREDRLDSTIAFGGTDVSSWIKLRKSV